MPLLTERANSRDGLVAKGYAARLDQLENKQDLAELQGSLLVQKNRLKEARAAHAATKRRHAALITEFQSSVLDELVQAREQAAALEQELIKAEKRRGRQRLTAPIDGVVQQLAVHTVGGVVTPAQALMVIVPEEGEIEVNALILNKDIGFVQVGQKVEVKVDSFPFTKYGTLDGTLKVISSDAVEDEEAGLTYPARVALQQTQILVDKSFVPITPGMSVAIEIKTGKRKLIEYILAPLQRYQDESLRER